MQIKATQSSVPVQSYGHSMKDCHSVVLGYSILWLAFEISGPCWWKFPIGNLPPLSGLLSFYSLLGLATLASLLLHNWGTQCLYWLCFLYLLVTFFVATIPWQGYKLGKKGFDLFYFIGSQFQRVGTVYHCGESIATGAWSWPSS